MATFADLGPWKGNDNLIGLDSRIKNYRDTLERKH